MRTLFFALLSFVCLVASGEVRYKDQDFSLALDGDWVQLPLLFVEHVGFRSEALGLHVKIMGITERVRPGRTRLVASKLLEETIRREIASAKPGVKVSITHQEVSDIEGGTAATYRGYDSSGRAFLTVEHIYPERSVMLFFEAPEANAQNLDAAAAEVLRGLFK